MELTNLKSGYINTFSLKNLIYSFNLINSMETKMYSYSKKSFGLKNLLLIAITFAFANVFTFAADGVEIAQADITRMLGNSHQTAPFDFNYSVDDNGAIHYSFKENNPTNAHNTYRIYANGKQIYEGVGAIEGAFTPEPNSGDIKLTVSQQVDSK